jgi:hypothetical protein
MATTPPSADPSDIRAASEPLRVPPDDTIWKRYSPHHEAPLSFVGSAALHLVVLGLLILYVVVLVAWFKSQPVNLPIETVHMGGGGGNPKGKGDGPGIGELGKEVVGNPQEGDPKSVEPEVVQRPPLTLQEANTIKQEFANDPAADRLVYSEQGKMLARLDKEVRDKLREGVNPGAGKGGVGEGGGKGTGEGKKSGPGQGDGKMLNEREQRMLRWTMSFNTRNGQDYLNQLRYLGAIVAVPTGDGRDYKTCDLTKGPPYELVNDDLSNIKRIYWVDDKPSSVRSLMGALGVGSNPSHFVAFMPEELEKRLSRMEQQYRGLPEDKIYETKFDCFKGPDGKYDVRVTAQTPK